MNGNDALLHALSGTPICHKDFKDPNRFIVCVEAPEGLEFIDTASDSPTQWFYLIDHYGENGWRLFNPPRHAVVNSTPDNDEDDDATEYLDASYLSDQMEELAELIADVTPLLKEVLRLADLERKEKPKAKKAV